MEEASRRNAVSPEQKKRLFQLLVKHPKLLLINHYKSDDTDTLTHRDGRALWKRIAAELNAIEPGVKKPWRLWRKSWQDFKSRTKKQHQRSGKIPITVSMLTPAEMEAIGIKNATTNERTPEFVPMVGKEIEIGKNEPTINSCNKDPTNLESFNNDSMESCDSDSTIESSDNNFTVTERKYMATSPQQKKRLLQLIVKHPKLLLLNYGATDLRTQIECRKLWKKIATELNTITPGVKKTWDKWRKNWQSLKFRAKKQHQLGGKIPIAVSMLTPAEMEAIGLKKMSAIRTCENSTEFVPVEDVEIEIVDIDPNSEGFANELTSISSVSEPESFTEEKLLTSSENTIKKRESPSLESAPSHDSHKESSSCTFNCEMLSLHEQKKVQIQEDYYTFKKDYLKQKLAALKMQAEALKTIAKELSNK